jgi:hypothetical protein
MTEQKTFFPISSLILKVEEELFELDGARALVSL